MRAGVLDALGWVGSLYSEVRLHGRTLHLVVDVDVDEVRKRQGLPSPDRDELWAFSLLPEQVPIPMRAIEPAILAALGGSAWVTQDGESVVRHYRPPLRIVGVAADRKRWQDSLEAVGIFAADAQRAIIVRDRPSPRSRIWRVTQDFGIGLVVDDGARGELLHSPDRHLVRPGPELWSLTEEAYSLLATKLTRSDEPTHAVPQTL